MITIHKLVATAGSIEHALNARNIPSLANNFVGPKVERRSARPYVHLSDPIAS